MTTTCTCCSYTNVRGKLHEVTDNIGNTVLVGDFCNLKIQQVGFAAAKKSFETPTVKV